MRWVYDFVDYFIFMNLFYFIFMNIFYVTISIVLSFIIELFSIRLLLVRLLNEVDFRNGFVLDDEFMLDYFKLMD